MAGGEKYPRGDPFFTLLSFTLRRQLRIFLSDCKNKGDVIKLCYECLCQLWLQVNTRPLFNHPEAPVGLVNTLRSPAPSHKGQSETLISISKMYLRHPSLISLTKVYRKTLLMLTHLPVFVKSIIALGKCCKGKVTTVLMIYMRPFLETWYIHFVISILQQWNNSRDLDSSLFSRASTNHLVFTQRGCYSFRGQVLSILICFTCRWGLSNTYCCILPAIVRYRFMNGKWRMQYYFRHPLSGPNYFWPPSWLVCVLV